MNRIVLAALVSIIASAGLVAQTDTTVYEPANGVSLPTVVKEVRPEYTSEAMARRIEGKVKMTGVVRQSGRVTDITVAESLDAMYGLDKAAVEAFGQFEFKPGTKDGRPVAVKITVEMAFTLR